MDTAPSYALPLFGTFSLVSFLGLIVLVLKLKDDLTRSVKDTVLNSPEFAAKLDAHATKLKESLVHVYVTQTEYRNHYARLKHLETVCKECEDSKMDETKFPFQGGNNV
jgi:predicted solute-binding protein